MTKKEIMIKAHEMTKDIKNEYPKVDYKFQLGLCLAFLHSEGVKEMVELQGTEKQIAWAEKIREDMIAEAKKSNETNEQLIAKRGRLSIVTEAFRNNLKAFFARVEIETSAKWYIENRDRAARMYSQFWN